MSFDHPLMERHGHLTLELDVACDPSHSIIPGTLSLGL
jgi:hypothetical protein